MFERVYAHTWVALASLLLVACADEGETGVPDSDWSGAFEVGSPPERVEACIGIDVPFTGEAPVAGAAIECPTCAGASPPGWQLEDFQPQSCGYGAVYGLDAFRGRTLLVALLSAGCGFCLSQTQYLEQMRLELEAEGAEIEFVLVNHQDQAAGQERMTERASFPMFQDVAAVGAWDAHEGHKDDIYIYSPEGLLLDYFPSGGDRDLALATEEGYANVMGAIRSALGE